MGGTAPCWNVGEGAFEPTASIQSVRYRRGLGALTTARGARALATAAMLLSVVSACDDDTDASQREPSASGSSTKSARVSDNEIASDRATKLVRSYYPVRDELRQQPDLPLSKLQSVTVSTELAAQRKLFVRERKDGLRQTGDTRIAELTVQSVSLDNSDPQAGKVPTVEIDVCFDVSDVDILDRNGASVVTDDRPETGWIRYSVANYERSKNPEDGWRVASSEDLERAPCDVS